MTAELASGEGVIAREVRKAKSFLERLRGLMYRKILPEGEALMIEPCDSIHTFGMRFPIDVLFLNTEGVILKAVFSLKPGKVVPPVKGGRAVLELNAGSLPKDLDLEGKTIRFEG